MLGIHEGKLAWDLAEQHRSQLTEEERTIAFVHLGVGDYPPAIGCILNSVVRQQLELPPDILQRLQAWIRTYQRDDALRSRLELLLSSYLGV